MTSFELVEFNEPPGAFHQREVPDRLTPQVWWNLLNAPALVLGSTQRDESIVDSEACRRGGVDVVRRRSGGGAVLLIPGEVVWFDVIIPTGTVPGIGDDVHGPMSWLGERVAAVLQPHATGEITVKGPGMVTTAWSSLICFDGVGPGELLLDGKKLLGISQRRTRAASRLQCCWYSTHDPARLVGLLDVEHRPPVGQLRSVATLSTPADIVFAITASLTVS